MVAIGLAVASRPAGGVTRASAVAGDHLQIAPASTRNFGSSADGIWVMQNAGAGDSVTGSVLLRTVGSLNPLNSSLRLSASLDGTGNEAFASRLFVTAMVYDSEDVLPLWSGCLAGNQLSVASLAACPGQSLLPLPAPGDGTPFSMTVELDPDAPNELQGQRSGVLTLTFRLADTTADSSNPAVFEPPGGNPAAGTHPLPSGSTSKPPSATASTPPAPAATDVVAGERTPGAAATAPAPPRPTPIAPGTGGGSNHSTGFPWALLFLVAGLVSLGSSALRWMAGRTTE